MKEISLTKDELEIVRSALETQAAFEGTFKLFQGGRFNRAIDNRIDRIRRVLAKLGNEKK